MKALLVLLLLLYSSFSQSKQNAKSTKLVIPLNNWESQRVVSTAIGQVLESSGFTVSYADISSELQWGALKRGAIDFQLEVWEPSMKGEFEHLLAKGQVVDLGSHQAKVTEDWWYPKYVEKLCPGLPDWRALNQCKSLFENRNSKSKGIYYTGPWNYADGDIIRALNVDFTIEHLSTSAELWQELNAAIKIERPIILLNWTPNWTDKHLAGEFVKFPSHSKECDLDPEWGINKAFTKDCANPKDGWLKKVASTQLKQKSACVYQFIKNINFSAKMLRDASYLMVVERMSEGEAAHKWLSLYANDVIDWTPKNCAI